MQYREKLCIEICLSCPCKKDSCPSVWVCTKRCHQPQDQYDFIVNKDVNIHKSEALKR